MTQTKSETIQVWNDQTEADRPYIVSRGIDGEDAPFTLGVFGSYDEAIARARDLSASTGLAILDQCEE